MNFFPLCTAMVCPIMSGTIVERRDHVLITFFSLRVFSPSTLMRRWPSTNGPFFSERAIDSLFLHSPQAAPWCPPHLLTQRREGPGRLRMIALDLSFAAPVRMIHGIHGHAANGGFFPVPPRAPGFSVGFVLMVEVADLAHRRHALHGKLAHFAGRQLHQREITFFAQQL